MEAAQARALAAVDAAEAAAETQQKDTALLARLRYLRGKACASTADGQGSAEAETLLADAVKLDPLLVDAWNCLGECFWARGEFPLAMHTLKGALAHRRDPATLCKLSQLLRAMGAREAQKGDAQQKEKHLVEARKMAKEARARARRATRRPAQFVGPRNSSARAMFRPAHFVGPRNSARARLRRRPRPRPRPAGGRAGAGVAAVLEAPRLLPLQDLRRPRARGRPPDRRQEGVHAGPPPRPRRPRQGRRRRRRRRRRQPDGDGVGGAGAVGGDGGGVCVRRRRPLRHAREHVRRAGGVWRRAAAVRRPPRPPAHSGGAIPPAQRRRTSAHAPLTPRPPPSQVRARRRD